MRARRSDRTPPPHPRANATAPAWERSPVHRSAASPRAHSPRAPSSRLRAGNPQRPACSPGAAAEYPWYPAEPSCVQPLPHAPMCLPQPIRGAARSGPSPGEVLARLRPPPGEVPRRGPTYPCELHDSAALRETRRLLVYRRELSRSADPFPGVSLAMPFRGEGPRLAQRYCGELQGLGRVSPGEQPARASPGEVPWIGLPCRGEQPASEERARGEWSMGRCCARVPRSKAMTRASLHPRQAVLACQARSPATRSPPGGMERPRGEEVRSPQRGGAGGERRVGVPGPTPRARAEARSGSPPHHRPSPTTAFRPGTRGPRGRTRAAGATRSASRRPRCRRRPTAPRRSGPPRGTRWCSRRRGARRRGCGSCPATRGTPRRSGSPRE